MSCGPPSIMSKQDEKEDDSSIDTYQGQLASLDYTVNYISSAFTNVQELQTEFSTQYQHEKYTLTELNKRLQVFVDYVQQLESENAKYIQLLANCRPDNCIIDTESEQCYLGVQSNLMQINQEKVNYDLEFELSQLQIGTYKHVFHWKDERRLKLEQELIQSSSTLADLRTAYADMERQVDSVCAIWKNTFHQHLTIISDWCQSKKETFALLLCTQALKNQTAFYKEFVSHSKHLFESLTVDVKQFSMFEFDKIVKKIRNDFEQFYKAVDYKLAEYYQMKMTHLDAEVKKILKYQQTDIVAQTQILSVEHEQVQKSCSKKKELLLKMESTYSTLESQLQSVQTQNQQILEEQSKELQSLQESIMAIVCHIEETRQRKIELESEIIVYCNLLDAIQMQNQQVVVCTPPSIESTKTRKLVVKINNKGPIGILCPPDGTYISLVNRSKTEVNISRWILKRRLNSKREFRYTLPDGILLGSGRELRIYSKRGAADDEVPPTGRCVLTSLRQEYINNKLDSWGICDTTETVLFDENDVEKAFYSQSIAPK
ncbi:unnamed protein product [Adineta ricciae]|uniref:LTD domain-containing protein n=1 Tax=Adineta ricciae TaxID=249248 RepID=A0A815I782_ADIRI|nr:unnamed protein product [Adineta ricciae]CAF1362115.1 unnamed protein product [Adineta ricciae]